MIKKSLAVHHFSLTKALHHNSCNNGFKVAFLDKIFGEVVIKVSKCSQFLRDSYYLGTIVVKLYLKLYKVCTLE